MRRFVTLSFNRLVPGLLLLSGLIFWSCKDISTDAGGLDARLPGQPVNMEKSVVKAGNSFGFKLFAQLNAATAGKNLFVSPLSVSMALGMTMNGSAGATRDAMGQALEYAGMSQSEINRSYKDLMSYLTGLDPTVLAGIANSIWYCPDLQVEETFKSVNMQYFNAEVTLLDFRRQEAAGIVNGWVSRSTHGKIPTIVPDPIPGEIVMYLINAVYFKGSWKYRFDSAATRDGMFTAAGGTTVPCRMMRQQLVFPYFSLNGIQGIELPYGGGKFSMVVLLPPAGASVDEFAGGLTQADWEGLVSRLDTCEVYLELPRFKVEYEVKLNEILKALGMGIAFTGDADFTGIDKRGNLCISEVRHKTFVQLDEAGTEAAAVTLAGMRTTSGGGGNSIPVMILNRPFLYVIREKDSGSILFMGKMANPA